MLYLTCTTITSVDLPHYGISRAKDWVSVDCGTRARILRCNLIAVLTQACTYSAGSSPGWFLHAKFSRTIHLGSVVQN